MALYDDFYDSLLPGNYALTKSMELTKVGDSGTLWYTKKFLTLYYFIFLSNDIMTMAYKDKVIEIFDSYIASLDATVRDAAKLYFYPENEAINFKSADFNYFSNFASATYHADQTALTEYYQSAKKYYFSLLMGSGGQTGIKKQLKEAVQQPGFVYSHANIDSIILRSAIDVCIKDANALHSIRDNSIKYIISDEAIDKICEISCRKAVDESDIHQAMTEFPNNNPKYRGIESDMIAFIRNERQILYYYGYFHSKTSGAADFEFSSLTPIGELALYANSYEFLAIWEHQKVKMISQPVTVDINDLHGLAVDSNNFNVSTTPYTDILGCLIRRNHFALDEYKYIISRRKDSFEPQVWENEESTLFEHKNEIKDRVDGFGRQRDKADEDARKELLKYLLGVRNDLGGDANTNPLNILCFAHSTVSVVNMNSLILLYNVYSKLDDYKKVKYSTVYSESVNDLKNRYDEGLRGASSPVNGRSKIHWDLYNIHSDKFILLGIITAISAISLNYNGVENASRNEINYISQFSYEKFGGVLRKIGLRSLSAVKREINRIINALRNEDYSDYLEVDGEQEAQVLAAYRTESAADLMVRIEQISLAACVDQNVERSRNINLVRLLKSYYMARYAENNTLICECCGEETFITDAGEPYVEFHHLIPFSIAYGPDHYLNLFALCPNCHRKIHFLKVEDKHEQYERLSNNNYLHICFVDRLMELKTQNLLKSYHLEYLLTDNAITQDEYDQIAA